MLSIRHSVSVRIRTHIRTVGNKTIVTSAPLVVQVHPNRCHTESRVITRSNRLVRGIHRDVRIHRQRRCTAHRRGQRNRIAHHYLVREGRINCLNVRHCVAVLVRTHVCAVRREPVVARLPLVVKVRTTRRHTERRRTTLTRCLVRRIHRDVRIHRQRRCTAHRRGQQNRVAHHHFVCVRRVSSLNVRHCVSVLIRAHVRAVRGKTIVALLPLVAQVRTRGRHTERRRATLTRRLVRRIHRDCRIQ